jgi:hypothetical protein
MRKLLFVALVIAGALWAAPAQAASIELTDFDGGAFLANGDYANLAGTHPHSASTTFHLAYGFDAEENTILPLEDLKDTFAKLPPGLIGNPEAVEACSGTEFSLQSAAGCPAESQVGVFTLTSFSVGGALNVYKTPIFNLTPPKGTAALLGFYISSIVSVTVSARVRSEGDYGITASGVNTQQSVKVVGAEVEVWGVPADQSHDGLRTPCLSAGLTNGSPSGKLCPSADAANPKAFFTLPTSCTGPVETFLEVVGWQGGTDAASFLSHDNVLPIPNPIGIEGCDALEFSPTLEARPTTNVADSPSGLDVDLHIPQDQIEEPSVPVEAHLKDTTVTLPQGMTVNPSGANGLDACSPAQAGLLTPVGATPIHFSDKPTGCPDAAKIGTVQVSTPILDHKVNGALYIATPYDNPFNSLLALYITVNDPQTGTAATIAGEVHADPNTGQLTTTVKENPQLPLEDIVIHVKGGAHGSLRTPSTCATYQVTSSLTPWSAPDSGPPATPSDSWAISQGPGGACATSEAGLPNSPSFDAGTVSPIAGAYSPFVVHLRREDGTQNFAAITLNPPPGLVAKLAGTPYCPEAALSAAATKTGRQEQQGPSCPAASRVGSVSAAAGAGPSPYHASGEAYLAGPYKGAPLSLAIITPAVAGPFDLGNVVIKTALDVDPESARVTATSDPLPRILQGIPLDIRSVDVSLDKPSFTLNPTSCDPMAVAGQLTTTLAQSIPLKSRFQLAECTRLGFKPKLSLKLKGGTKRGAHPALTATVSYPKGSYANIKSASVTLPHSEFLDQAHIGTVCTRVQFAADACPAASVYGKVKATTPLLDKPLEGPVYLRSSTNKLPDLVFDLKGQIHVAIAGRVDSVHGGIRTSFESVPDAPVSSFTLQMAGGKKGLLINSRNICASTNKAIARFSAHNGRSAAFEPELRAKCGGKAKKHKRRGR